METLASGPHTVPDLATELYCGLPAELHTFAKLQVLAGLTKLQ